MPFYTMLQAIVLLTSIDFTIYSEFSFLSVKATANINKFKIPVIKLSFGIGL